MKDKHFHGVCILKYYKYTPARGVRPSLPMEADVDDSMSSGDLFLVVFPKPPPCDVQLFGRNFVEILEDTKRPPTFKVTSISFHPTFKQHPRQIKGDMKCTVAFFQIPSELRDEPKNTVRLLQGR